MRIFASTCAALSWHPIKSMRSRASAWSSWKTSAAALATCFAVAAWEDALRAIQAMQDTQRQRHSTCELGFCLGCHDTECWIATVTPTSIEFLERHWVLFFFGTWFKMVKLIQPTHTTYLLCLPEVMLCSPAIGERWTYAVPRWITACNPDFWATRCGESSHEFGQICGLRWDDSGYFTMIRFQGSVGAMHGHPFMFA